MAYRNVLVLTLGSAPAVVTETVYALLRPEAQDGEPAAEPWIPDEIHVVTTAKGREEGKPLLRGSQSKLAELFSQLGHSPVDANFVVPTLSHGAEVQDIRTGAENIAYANRLTALIEELARRSDTRLHVSMAGGRKTMSAYAHAAISLFGRAQDALSHILVEPQVFETARSNDFLWPGQPHEVFEQGHSSNDARVILVRCPFVPLGDYLRRHHPFPNGDIDYARIVDHARTALSEPELVLDVAGCTVTFAGKTVSLGEQEFAFLRVLAAAKIEGWPGFGPGGAGVDQLGWVAFQQFLDPNSTAYARFFDYWRDCFPGLPGEVCETFKQALDARIGKFNDPRPNIRKAHRVAAQDMLKPVKNRVLKKLEREFGATSQIRLHNATFRRDGNKGTCVGLHIAPSAITIRKRGDTADTPD
jgi:CRISPR-associated protein (TIGR02584 family)